MFILYLQVPRKFNMKKSVSLVIILLLLFLSILVMIHYTTISYDFYGTYSAGNEPDKNNINIVLKNKEFTIYNQEKILEIGTFDKIDINYRLDIYTLTSRENNSVGYIVHDKNHIILLDFMSTDILLKKISTNVIYLNYDSE